jgi:GNAT superfamily N-acetyltransferase
VTIEFRPARVDDGGDGERLIKAMAAEIALIYDGLDFNAPDMPKAGPGELAPPGGGFWVGYEGDTPVCCGGVKPLKDGAGEIKRMYVAPAARGRGVARQLLAHLEQAARNLGYTVARLDTGPRQPAAQHIYTSAGYVQIGNFNDNPVSDYFGEKQL